MAVCGAHQGLPVGFLLLRCSVLFAVGSLSLLYLLLFLGLCVLGSDGLGVLRADWVSVCLGPRLGWGWGWRHGAGLGPPVGCFAGRSRASFVFFCPVLSVPLGASVCVCLVVACWRVGGGEGAALLALVCGV